MMWISYSRFELNVCIYLKPCDDRSYIILMLYVDDMLIVAKNIHKIVRLKVLLKNEFDMLT